MFIKNATERTFDDAKVGASQRCGRDVGSGNAGEHKPSRKHASSGKSRHERQLLKVAPHLCHSHSAVRQPKGVPCCSHPSSTDKVSGKKFIGKLSLVDLAGSERADKTRTKNKKMLVLPASRAG